MNDTHTLDDAINKATFRSAVILIVAGILSLFFPLDAPEGPFAERVIWFSSNVGAFVIGWVVQMIAMLSLSGVFAGVAWQIREPHPLRAFVAGAVLLISVVAFIIPKFIAIWSIPQMVVSSAAVALGAYGLLYHILFAGVMTGSVVTADIGTYAESIGALLLIPVISMAVYFRKKQKDVSGE